MFKFIFNLWRIMFGGSNEVSVVEVKVDPWVLFEIELTAKLEWANSIDSGEVANETGSTPEKVEEVAGYPGLWREFGLMIKSNEKCNLGDILNLGKRIRNVAGESSDLWVWYKAYMRSKTGWGPLGLEEYRDLSREQIYTLSRIIDVFSDVGRKLKEFKTFNEYRAIALKLTDIWYNEEREYLHLVVEPFESRKNILLTQEEDSCKTTDELVRLYHSIWVCGSSPGDGAYWICGCNNRRNLGFKIRKLVEAEIGAAKTASQAEAINVPKNIQTSSSDISEHLNLDKRRMIQQLKQQEENDRILSVLKK